MTAPVEYADSIDPVPGAVFNPDIYPWKRDVKRALDGLRTKIPYIDRAWSYYDGDHPRLWLTDYLRKLFEHAKLADGMAENWCDVAVDAPLHRLRFTGWDANEIQVKAIENVVDDNDLNMEQTDLYRTMRVAGEAFLFVWKDPDKDSGFDVCQNDPRNVWWPDDSHRSRPDLVVKIWAELNETDDMVWRATLIYKLEVVRLIGPRCKDTEGTLPASARYFNLDPDEPGGLHGFDYPPVIRFALGHKRQSIVDAIYRIQDRINKLESNKMVASEWTAFRRLAILTQQTIDDDTLKFRPNRAVVLDPGGEGDVAPTSIWEGSATELSNYDDSIQQEIFKLFTKATLPRHMLISTGSDPSGAFVEADEGPFVELIKNLQRVCGASWTDLWDLVGFGNDTKPIWNNAAVKSDASVSTVVKTLTDAGMPLELALKYYAAWTPEQINELVNQPATMSSTVQSLQGLSHAVALGGMDAEHARMIAQKLLPGETNGTPGTSGPPNPQSTGTIPPNPQ